jgi:hypothetical protein
MSRAAIGQTPYVFQAVPRISQRMAVGDQEAFHALAQEKLRKEQPAVTEQCSDLEGAAHGVIVGCLYLPNGNPQPGPKFDYKLAWFERLIFLFLLPGEFREFLGSRASSLKYKRFLFPLTFQPSR